jgi:hypothetical protein
MDSQLQNQSSVYSDELNATILHLNHLGQYHILYDVRMSPTEWFTAHNVSILIAD